MVYERQRRCLRGKTVAISSCRLHHIPNKQRKPALRKLNEVCRKCRRLVSLRQSRGCQKSEKQRPAACSLSLLVFKKRRRRSSARRVTAVAARRQFNTAGLSRIGAEATTCNCVVVIVHVLVAWRVASARASVVRLIAALSFCNSRVAGSARRECCGVGSRPSGWTSDRSLVRLSPTSPWAERGSR